MPKNNEREEQVQFDRPVFCKSGKEEMNAVVEAMMEERKKEKRRKENRI